jgi:nitrate reductase NapE component
MTIATSSRSTAAALAWVAAATAVFYLVVLAVLHALRTDVDPATDPVSDYAVGDYGTLEVLAMLAVGLGALALTAALHQTPRRSTVGLVLLAVFGLAKVAQAFFPIDVGGETTTSGGLHSVLGTVAFVALPVAAVLLSRSRGRIEMVVAVLLTVAMLAVLAADAVGGYGIAQRVFLVLSSTWVLVTAFRLALGQPAPSSGTTPAE